MHRRVAFAYLLFAVGCAEAPKPDRVEVTLAPDIVSSQSAQLVASATVFDGDVPLPDWAVSLVVDYADRNGTAHSIGGITASADAGGVVLGSFEGLSWQGIGTVTATVLDAAGAPALDEKKAQVTSHVPFSVLDETPPTLSITAPASGTHIQRGQYNVTVAVADEIGVSQVYIQAVNTGGGTPGTGGGGGGGGQNSDRTRSTILASGTTSSTVTLGFSSEGANVGDTIKIYAMAADMSGNLDVASSISFIVDAPPP